MRMLIHSTPPKAPCLAPMRWQFTPIIAATGSGRCPPQRRRIERQSTIASDGHNEDREEAASRLTAAMRFSDSQGRGLDELALKGGSDGEYGLNAWSVGNHDGRRHYR